MNTLTEQNIDFIYQDVQTKGITMEVLLDEMVDHICCSIEPEINQGTSFEIAYNNLMSTIESSTFKTIQHRTELSTNLKFLIMKKSMIVIGSLSALLLWIGSILKMLHIPPASAILLLGAALTVLGFFPLFFYTSYKEQMENKNVFLSITGYLTLSFLIVGILLKVMHWPGAAKTLLAGELMLILLFLPLYLVNAYKKASEKKARVGYTLLIVLIGFGVIFMVSATSLSKDLVDTYNNINIKANTISQKFSEQNESLANSLKTQESYDKIQPKIENLRVQAANLDNQIESIKTELESNVDNERYSDNEKAFRKIMLKDNNAITLKEDFAKYKALALELSPNEYAKETLSALLDFNSLTGLTYERAFKRTPLVIGLAMLSNMQKNIKIAEYEILSSYQ